MATEYTLSGNCVYSIMMEKSAKPGKGGGAPSPFHSIYHHEQSCMWCTLQLRGQILSPYFSSTPMYSVVTLTLYLQKWTKLKSFNTLPNCFSQKLSIRHIFEHLKYKNGWKNLCVVLPLTKKERVHWLRSSVKVAYGTKHLVWRTNNNLPKDSVFSVKIDSWYTFPWHTCFGRTDAVHWPPKKDKIILIIGSLF